ncbi:helix-turn-helix domain-containing protein [Mesorhizobium loti]|nr:helix-turn-helix domain-containing protein [Mesorhizobium loti]
MTPRYFDDLGYGAAIKRARTERGLSYKNIANAFKVSLALVSYVERGGEPTPDFVAAAKSKLKVDRERFGLAALGRSIQTVANQNEI